MGDCRMRILISKDIVPQHFVNASSSSSSTNESTDMPSSSSSEFHVITRVFSADTTVREVAEDVLESLWSPITLLLDHNVCLWDCTLHPPKDITDWPLDTYSANAGPKSKTLYDAGWFPSGTWQVLRKGQVPSASIQSYTDSQYNLPVPVRAAEETTSIISGSTTVQLQNAASLVTMKPSEVLQSAKDRFQHETTTDIEEALRVRKQKKLDRQHKEAARHARLEARIQTLQQQQSTKKNEKVSTQVRNMLIKSRCTGSASLKMQDRVYLHFFIVHGDDVEEDGVETRQEYRYFSQQDTVARIVSAVANVKPPQDAELLIQLKDSSTLDSGLTYRRLPIAMRLYEAIAKKFIQEVDSVLIRCFCPPEEEATTSILDDIAVESDDLEEAKESIEQEAEGTADATDGTAKSPMPAEPMEVDTVDLPDRVKEAISTLDKASAAKIKKRSSAALEKVRTMKMKSSAKGDAKRIPNVEDRFFLELVVALDDSEKVSTTLSNVYLARSDPIGRMLRDCTSVPAGHGANIFVIDANSQYQILPQDITFVELESKGTLNCFGRLVVRLFRE